MKKQFVAVRFLDDENIANNAYWYACSLEVKEGEEVLAPVGMHSRLQKGRVERILFAEEENAPYDVSMIKHVVARYGHRRLPLDTFSRELGGLAYDHKHYTRFSSVVAVYGIPDEKGEGVLLDYGVSAVFDFSGKWQTEKFSLYTFPMKEENASTVYESETLFYALKALASCNGCVSLGGSAFFVEAIALLLLRLAGVSEKVLSSEKGIFARKELLKALSRLGDLSLALCDLGLTREEVFRLKQKLT